MMIGKWIGKSCPKIGIGDKMKRCQQLWLDVHGEVKLCNATFEGEGLICAACIQQRKELINAIDRPRIREIADKFLQDSSSD